MALVLSKKPSLNLFDIPQIILKFVECIGKTIHQGKLPKLIIENRNIERV